MAQKPPLAVEKFGGMVPILDDRALPDQFAASSENCALYAQILQGFNVPRKVFTLKKASTRYAFRIPDDYANSDLYDASHWLEFDHPDTSVIRTPTIEDRFDRYYWVEPGKPPQYNTAARIRNGDPPYTLGIPTPTVAPGVTPSGGTSNVFVARAYVYTWVSSFSEEGPPAPPTLKNGKEDDVWHITVTAPPPTDVVNRDLKWTNIYRTVTSSNGVATYFFVTQIPITQLTFDDNISDAVIANNNQLQSTDWGGPPADLKGMVSMPNGIILGWNGTDVLFCEPYRPHAWPSAYGLSTDYRVVGAGVFGQSGVLCTESAPHVVTGNHPSIMTMQKINIEEPCLARGSIVSGTQGVYYASPNGLCLVNPSGVSVVTKQVIGMRHWRELLTPEHLRAVRYTGVYIAFDVDDGSVTPPQPSARQFGCIVDPMDERVAFCRLSNKVPVTNVLLDIWSGRMLLLGIGENSTGNAVWEFDPPDGTEQIVYVWKSKRFHTKKKTNFGVAKLYFDAIGVQHDLDNPWVRVNDGVLPEGVPLRLRLWANDALVYDENLFNSGEQISLPGGFKREWWQFEITARVNCVSIHMGVDARDLAQV